MLRDGGITEPGASIRGEPSRSALVDGAVTLGNQLDLQLTLSGRTV